VQHLLKHLEHFLSSLLSSKDFYVALIGAVVGGSMAGIFALFTQKQAAKDQRQRDLEIEQRTVNGSLQAIATELKLFKEHALDPLDRNLVDLSTAREVAKKEHGDEPDPFVKNPITQNYFIIFESNTAVLGRISSERLRIEIIGVYSFCKDLVERLNATYPEYQRWRDLSYVDREKYTSENKLMGFEDGIRNAVNSLKREIPDVLSKIEKYVDP
jgi:hypothetical protein